MKNFILISIFLTIILSCNSTKVLKNQLNINPHAIKAIRETLPSYLDKNINSPASFLKGNYSYEKFYNFHIKTLELYGFSKDTLDFSEIEKKIELARTNKTRDSTEIDEAIEFLDHLKNVKSGLNNLEKHSDTIAEILTTKKIQVILNDSIFQYKYIAEEFEDLTDNKEWEKKYELLKQDFKYDYTMTPLDKPINIEYADLIKKQIDSKENKKYLILSDLNYSYYAYNTNKSKCNKDDLCFQGEKLYLPVFNNEMNKGCYLFSYKCSTGICRDFIFIEKKNGKWNYVADYVTNRIGNED